VTEITDNDGFLIHAGKLSAVEKIPILDLDVRLNIRYPERIVNSAVGRYI